MAENGGRPMAMIASSETMWNAAKAPSVRLVPPRAEHPRALLPLLDDLAVVRMLAEVDWPVTADATLRHLGVATPLVDGFVVMADGIAVGEASVKHVGSGNPPRRMPRLGFWIGRRHHGQGIGTALVRLLCAHAFATTDAATIGAGVFNDNPASRRVLEKTGFRRAGGYLSPCRARGGEVMVDDMHLARGVVVAAEAVR